MRNFSTVLFFVISILFITNSLSINPVFSAQGNRANHTHLYLVSMGNGDPDNIDSLAKHQAAMAFFNHVH